MCLKMILNNSFDVARLVNLVEGIKKVHTENPSFQGFEKQCTLEIKFLQFFWGRSLFFVDFCKSSYFHHVTAVRFFFDLYEYQSKKLSFLFLLSFLRIPGEA